MGWAKISEASGFARLVDTITGDVVGVNDDKPKKRGTTASSGVTREEVNELRKRIGSLEAKLERRDETISRLKDRLTKLRVVKKKRTA